MTSTSVGLMELGGQQLPWLSLELFWLWLIDKLSFIVNCHLISRCMPCTYIFTQKGCDFSFVLALLLSYQQCIMLYSILQLSCIGTHLYSSVSGFCFVMFLFEVEILVFWYCKDHKLYVLSKITHTMNS